jgi:tRNA(Ile2) C34 agmatinyltransferase TiaS
MKPPKCPSCSGCAVSLLGSLGSSKAYRCRACGWAWVSLSRPRRDPIKAAQRHATPSPRDLRNNLKD